MGTAGRCMSLSTNARLRWEYLPGSEFFIVYSEGRDTLQPGLQGLQNRVFVVKVNRLLLTRNLELMGHSVNAAENGRIALDMLRRDRFDLVLLDMEMPEVDGFAVLAAMKQFL